LNPSWLPHDLTLARPQALYLLVVPANVLVWGLANARELRRIFAPLIRAVVLVLFVLALANPERVTRTEGAARPAMIDASASITPAMRAWTVKLLRDQLGLRGGDPAFMFANTVAHDSISSVEDALDHGAGCAACEPTATNLENALYRLASDPDAHGGPAVLVTDGWQNRGDAERAVSAILSAEIPLDIFTPPGAHSIPNVVMTELTLPPALEKAEPFELGVTMENLNDAPVNGSVTILSRRCADRGSESDAAARLGAARFSGPHRKCRPGFV